MRRFLKLLRKNFLRLLRWRRLLQQKLAGLFGGIRRAEHVFMVISAIIIGVLGAYGAIGFRYLIKVSHYAFFRNWEYSLDWVIAMPWWQKLLIPALGGLIVGPLVHYFAREVRGSGIPEVMEAVAVRGGAIRPRVILAKIFAASVIIGSGGSAGREGPIVQIGSAIGSFLGQVLAVSARRLRTFVACGAAAGIAATFNAPIAGALFAVEVILGEYAVAQFSPIVIASVVATVVSRHYMGDFPAFRVPAYELVSPYEFFPYLLLGILAGLIAVLFITTLYKSQDVFEGLKMPGYLKPALGGLLVGVIGLGLPQVFGVGYESINDALWGRDVSWLLALLVFAKLLATSLTLGSGGSGGIFAPSLFIGAMLGSLIGQQAHTFWPQLTAGPGAYALVGMGALVAATTHAPISAILIIFELTNSYQIIPPLMLSATIALLLATYLQRESIYTMKLKRRGINIFEGRDLNVLRSLFVKDVLNPGAVTATPGTSFNELISKILKSDHHEVFIVDKENRLMGVVSLDDVKEFLQDEDYLSGLVIADDVARPVPTQLYPQDNLDLVMHNFGRYNVDELPVVKSSSDSRLAGSVRRKDVIDAYNKEIFKADLVGGVHSVVSAVSNEREVELSEGYILREIDAPVSLVGKSLKASGIRSRYNVEIILIRHARETADGLPNRSGSVPTADYVLRPGDKLLVMGNAADIKKLL